MTSEVEICNIALGWLGSDPITSFDQQSQAARLCAINYEPIRNAELETAQWLFATDRAMSTATVRDSWDKYYVHTIPEGWLNVMRVYSDISDMRSPTTSKGWVREGITILAVDSLVYMWGIQEIIDTNKFPSLFVQCLAARIAADLAVPISHDTALQKDMWLLYEDKLNTAKAQDGKQGANERERSTILTQTAR